MPTEYRNLGKEGTSDFFSSSRAEFVPSTFYSPTPENGWRLTVYKTPEQQAEDEADVQDSLDALGEPQGISLDDLKRELGV